MSENIDIVRRVFAAFEDRDENALRELCAPEMVFEAFTGRMVERTEPYRGLDGLTRYLADVATVWQELRPAPDRFQEGSGGIVVATGRIYAWGAGRVIDSPAGWLWRVADGQLVYGRVFETADGALRAAGMSDRA